MKRISRHLAIASGTLALLGITVPGAQSAGPSQDHVVGGGQNNPPASRPIVHFQINARSGPLGEDPSGFFSFTRTVDGPPVEQFRATVTCVNVQGDMATVVGLVDRNKNDSFPMGRYYIVRVKDMGQGQDTMDEIQNGVYTGDPRVCPPPTEPLPEPITAGNLTVHDAI